MRTPPRPARPLLAAAAALVVSATALTGHAATSSLGSSTVAAGARTAPPDQGETSLAREAREAREAAAARRASADAARARVEQARAAARTAARAAAARQEAARKAAAYRAAKRAAQVRAQALARAKAAAAAKARAARSAARPATGSVPARTSWAALNRAIAAIPGYRDGIARWHVTSRYGHYGITDANQPGAANIYISPTVPAGKLYSVAAHEYGHAVVIANYGTGYGPYTRYSRDMVAWFGGTTVTGLERAADCIALRLGATWTNYTGCGDPHWQEGARILLRGGTL